VIKKEKISFEDQEVWSQYIEEMNDVYDKEKSITKGNKKVIKKVRVIDLHGLSLEKANLAVEIFIEDSFKKNFKKIKIITGKGNRSEIWKNPYVSSNLGVLKNSVPEFIKKNKKLFNKIINFEDANPEEGGSGAFFIILKNKF
jgi:DNA-nicking Smr family endonuclease